MSSPLEEAAAVRPGEELNPAAIAAYLRDALGIGEPPTIRQFPGGHSNLTYLIDAGSREIVLRRPPFGSAVKSAHDMGREYAILSRLSPVYPAAPAPLAYCADDSVLGAQFYLMERIAGVILRARKPTGFSATPEQVRGCCLAMVQGMADLHALEYRAIGLQDMYRGEGYVARQVSGWAKRYQAARTDDLPEVDTLIAWLADRVPPDRGACLIHNDYKPDNLVLDPADLSRIRGVLDWEMATIGDPLADLGSSLAYWTEPADGDNSTVQCFLTTEPGALTRREIAEAYAAATGRDISDILFYYLFGLLKLAGIVQQIYYRYRQGLTQDARFAALGGLVRELARRGIAAIEAGEI